MQSLQEVPPGYDLDSEAKPKTKAAKRNERKKEKRQQVSLSLSTDACAHALIYRRCSGTRYGCADYIIIKQKCEKSSIGLTCNEILRCEIRKDSERGKKEIRVAAFSSLVRFWVVKGVV